MSVFSWLDYSGGPWTWRHYLFISVVTIAVGAAVIFRAMRQGRAKAGAARLCRAFTGNRWKPGIPGKIDQHQNRSGERPDRS